MLRSQFEAICNGGEGIFDAPLSLESGIYDGNGAVLRLAGGLTLDGDNTVLKNFKIYGNVTVIGKNCSIVSCEIESAL